MTARVVLRVAAIAIAVAGAIDPVATVSRPFPQPAAITILGTGTDAAYDTAERVRAGIADLFDVVVRTQPATTDASPCPEEGGCVVISDGLAPHRLRARGPLGAVRVKRSPQPKAAITGVRAPARTDPDARGVVAVTIGSTDPAPLVRVFDGNVLVGESTTGRVEWTPIGRGLRDLRIATADDEAHVAVDVTPERHPVLIYEPQPTWLGTFVRRALENDPRFAIQTRARVANAITVSTGTAALDIPALERANSRVVIVTAVDQLTANEVAALDAFMTRRGGSVVALLDRPPAGASLALLPFNVIERREPEPVAIAQLEASEFVTFAPLDAVTTPLASAGNAAVVVSRPMGNGRVVVSGASDAWRFRDGNSFDEFWQGLIAGAADAAGDTLAITLDRQLARPHQRVRVDVEWRPLGTIPATIDARAALLCNGAPRPIRLWPNGAPGRFDGDVMLPAAGDCRVTATVNGVSGSTALMVRDVPTLADRSDGLSTAIAAHGGTVVNAGDENALVTLFRRSAARRDVSTQLHPMRSPLWIIPFAACLGGEWWLRRRTIHLP